VLEERLARRRRAVLGDEEGRRRQILLVDLGRHGGEMRAEEEDLTVAQRAPRRDDELLVVAP
jgi:hypothetical protein